MESREFEIIVPPGKVRERLDTFLARHVANATRSKVQHAVNQSGRQPLGDCGDPVPAGHERLAPAVLD